MIRLPLLIFGFFLATASFSGEISRTITIEKELIVQKGVKLLDVNFYAKRNKDGSVNNNGRLLIQKNANEAPTWVTFLDFKFVDKKKTKMLAIVLNHGHLECIETQDTDVAEEEAELPQKLKTEKIFQCNKCHVELAKFPAGFEGDPYEHWRKINGEMCPCCDRKLEFEEVVK